LNEQNPDRGIETLQAQYAVSIALALE